MGNLRCVILVLLSLFLVGCSTIRKEDEVEKIMNRMRESSKIPEDVVTFPLSYRGANWGKPQKGKEILSLSKKLNEVYFTSYIYAPLAYDESKGEVYIPFRGEDYLGDIAHTYGEASDYSDIGQYIGVHVYNWDTKSKGSYVGANAFGVTATVLDSESSDYRLIFGRKHIGNKSWLFLSDNCKAPSVGFENKEIKIQFLSKLVYPFHKSGVSFKSPTLNSPTRNETSNNYFKVEVVAARLVNEKTGVVYGCIVGYKTLRLFK